MDIIAHSLWAGLGAVAAARRWPVSRAQARAVVALAVLPDIGHLIPIMLWMLVGDGTWAAVRGYAFATPGAEPWLPAGVQAWSHTLHCVMHSAIVASIVTAVSWFRWRWVLVPLAGWWSHIVIDVFTHSNEYYPSPVLYPFTDRGFDGIAWTTPWFMVLNYAAIAATGLWVLKSGSRRSGGRQTPSA